MQMGAWTDKVIWHPNVEVDCTVINAVPVPGKRPREVFVAYPYRVYAQADYRKLFSNVGRALDVQFTFADEQISSTYVLEKIRAMIQLAQFGIYDISAWNPNVSLEFGLALGMNEKTFISFNPTHGDLSEVPSDIRGRDRIQYQSYDEYEQQITRLISAELPIPQLQPVIQVDVLRQRVLELLRSDAGLRIGDISNALGISQDLSRLLLRELQAQNKVKVDGATRGMRYFRNE